MIIVNELSYVLVYHSMYVRETGRFMVRVWKTRNVRSRKFTTFTSRTSHTTPHHTTPYHTTPHHTTPHHTTPHRIELVCHTIIKKTMIYITFIYKLAYGLITNFTCHLHTFPFTIIFHFLPTHPTASSFFILLYIHFHHSSSYL